MNNCIFTGRVTKELELQHTQNDIPYVRFSIANDTGYGDNKKTNFFNMTVWRKSAEAMATYVKKGQRILIECEAIQNKFTDKNGESRSSIEFTVQNWEFCDSKSEASDSGEASTPQTSQTPSKASSGDDFMKIPDSWEEELPFN